MDCLAFENQSKSNQILKILKMWIVVLKEKKKAMQQKDFLSYLFSQIVSPENRDNWQT